MAVTNAQVDQSQYSVPCVMQYVGCVGIPNFNNVFSRLLGDGRMEPVKCQNFCSGIGATYASLYDGYYCRCSIVPLTSQPSIIPVPESYCNRYDDIIFFLVDILVHLDHVLVNFNDNLSDNHRHITHNVFTHFNIFILLDDLSININLNKLINNKLPSQHPRPGPARTSTFEFVFDCLLYFDHICFIVQPGQYSLEHIKSIDKPGSFEYLYGNIIKQLQFGVILKHHHTSDKLKHTSDFGLFSFHYSSGYHFQQRIHLCNSTAFLDVSCFGSPSTPSVTPSDSSISGNNTPAAPTLPASTTSTIPTTGPLTIDTRSSSPTLASTSSSPGLGPAFLLTVTILGQPAPTQNLNP
ncbi:hypothetical protein BDP55DRAFT_735403 [Colletotrichum godetiae]|uniref:WSC domain-containing protein n=1 Tax=Colletotrichum godetiae TaxID=1209918 RepID=A0AAJ0A5E9_9PEZI|nr:uncharacterized protein BDP55DRAFT_735403 [Colletotrichum godetiae]KAK1656818.1 hypothetical protein BDP55DRAFT_735403 [Colletotrichum godetiae]